jgi:uncharacterized protein (TIGR00290 family)
VTRALLAWSSGKDSAWTLHTLRSGGDVAVVALLTTLREDADRVSMHAVRRTLLEAQARAAGVPLWTIPLPHPCPNAVYEARMAEAMARATAEGITRVAFGDLFLEDVRAYRLRTLAGTGLTPLFPLWGRPTDALARDMLAGGLEATITCLDPSKLDPRWVGHRFDGPFLDQLPAGVDPCGENGEFHTFCHGGPMFAAPIPVVRGEILERDGFWFADLTPA